MRHETVHTQLIGRVIKVTVCRDFPSIYIHRHAKHLVQKFGVYYFKAKPEIIASAMHGITG